MPTVFTHAVATLALPRASAPRLGLVLAACAVLPDADVLAFWLGIPYEHVLGHRGATHSVAFALVVAAVVTAAFYRRAPRRAAIAALVFAATLSHALLDMLTDGGLGVALFAPLSNARVFFPVRPVAVSPIGAGFFSARGAAVLLSEIVWIWAPALAIAAARRWWPRADAGLD